MEDCSGRIPNISRSEATGIEGKDSAHSFGLHSPEQLPCSEDEFKKLACSFGLHSPEAVSPECLHPSYNPRLFSDGQLYFDPEIIDLTLIPPPVTPDEKDTLMDFSSPTMAVPPPEFKDRNSPSTCQRSESPSFMMDLPSPIREKIDAMIQNDEDLSNHMAVIDALVSAELNRDRKVSEKDPRVSENESDSGNETIASDNAELGHSGISDVIDLSSLAVTEDQPLPHDLDALDIDAFIASMTVPPPPNDGSLNRPDIISTSGGTSVYLESVLAKISDSTSETNKDALVSISSPCTLPSSSEPDHINCINTSAGADTLSSSTSGFLSERFSTKDYSALELDDEIAKLVIPPPPVTSDAVLTEIPVVPPVSEVEDVEEDKEKDGSVSEVAPYDSPTALEGTRLVESLRAEYEHRLGSSPSPASAHEHSASLNQDLDGNQSLSTSSPYKKGLWQPALVSKSADSSPLHQVTESLAHSRVHNSIGTLPRLLRKRETPPPPPPRRSSMQPQLEKTRVRTSENIGSASLRHVVHQRSFSVPEESTSSCPPVTDSCSSLFNTGILKSDSNTQQSAATQEKSDEKDQQSRIVKNILTPGGSHSSPTFTKQSLAEEAAAVANKFTAMRRVPQKVKARSATIERDMTGSKVQSTFIPSRESLVSKSVTLDRDCSHNLHDMLEVSRSVDDINLQAYKDYKRSSSVSSSDSTKSSSTDSSTRFQSFKSKLKSYVAPSIYKKQQIFSRSSGKDKSDKSDLGAELHKSEYLNTSGCSSPSPSSPRSSVSRHVAAFSEFATGQHSPLSTRKSQLIDEQTSFSDSSDTKLKTFRTFLGDKSGASPPSIHKTAGIRTSLPHTKVEIPGLSKEKVVSSPKKVALPVVNLSTSVANVSISSAEQLSTAQQSVTIPKGKVLVKVPPAQGAHNGDSSENQVSGGKPSTEHGADGGGVTVTETGASDKVRVIRSELESKLDCKHFARETSRGSVSSERGEELLAALEVFTKYVQSHEYAGETTFTDANHDVDHMVGQLTEMLNKRLSRMSDRVAAADMKALKDSLIQNSRTFVTDSKLLVSSATQSKQKLVHHVNCSVHTLAKILFKSGQIITILNSRDGLKAFGSKVAEVAKAYTVTVEAASQAAGKPLSDPNMKLLMKRATSLAAILSSFMKTLKALETS